MDGWWKFWWFLMTCGTLIHGDTKETSRKLLPPARPVYAVLLLSYSDYLCPLCLQSFLQTADSLNIRPELRIGCVLVGDSNAFRDIPAPVVRAQFKGWIAASGLSFQTLVDEKGFLNPLTREGPGLFLFGEGGFIHYWKLPLSPDDLRAVIKRIKQFTLPAVSRDVRHTRIKTLCSISSSNQPAGSHGSSAPWNL